MGKTNLKWKNISKQDLESDFSKLLNFYNYDVKPKHVALSLDDIQELGVNLSKGSTSEIHKAKYTQLDNAIMFYSNPNKNDTKELIRHFKNLVSHPENIKKGTIEGETCYRIYDFKPGNPRKESMKGVISVEAWRKFTNEIMKKISDHLN